MPYYPNIPQSTDDPRESQSQLQQNFGKLNTDFAVNHSALTALQNAGFHTKVQFPAVLAVDPNLTSPQSSLYIKTVATKSELFFQNGANAADVYQLTNPVVDTTGTNYSIKTPWGLRLQMGTASGGTITFATPFSSLTLLTALATNIDGTTVRITAVNLADATYTTTGGSQIRYLIIGKE